ncbi:MAG: HAD family hydrolase [Candidatus Methanofastidiosia archaeon]
MIKAICFDLGDTLIAEETVIHNSHGQAITANIIEGVFEVLEALRKERYKIAMITNGDSAGVRNLIKVTGLEDYFDVVIISEEVGIEKPYQGIFEAALSKLGVNAKEAVMVGNRIDADILGANRFGMKSVWFRWNTRYSDAIDTSQGIPDFIINNSSELLSLLALM